MIRLAKMTNTGQFNSNHLKKSTSKIASLVVKSRQLSRKKKRYNEQ